MFEDIEYETSFLYKVCEHYDISVEPGNNFDALNCLAKLVGTIAVLKEREKRMYAELHKNYYIIEKSVVDEKKEKGED